MRSCPSPEPMSFGQVRDTYRHLRTADSAPPGLQGTVSLSLSPCNLASSLQELPAVMPEASVVPYLSSCHLTSGHQHTLLTLQDVPSKDYGLLHVTLPWTPMNPGRSTPPHFRPPLSSCLSCPEQSHMPTRLHSAAPVLFRVKARVFTDSRT